MTRQVWPRVHGILEGNEMKAFDKSFHCHLLERVAEISLIACRSGKWCTGHVSFTPNVAVL